MDENLSATFYERGMQRVYLASHAKYNHSICAQAVNENTNIKLVYVRACTHTYTVGKKCT